MTTRARARTLVYKLASDRMRHKGNHVYYAKYFDFKGGPR